MAKKGGAQQLQAEINTDEELYRLLEKPGLIVMDVYSEWCGPCLAMVGSLRKIKLELGGDTLHLAICKSDTIDAFERFRNKSEPTWLFATKGKLVNLMFGSDVPKLMKLIEQELLLLGSAKRTYYAITQLQPAEQARKDLIENAITAARNKEIEEARRAKLERLTYVTDEIMNNLPDFGVSIFGPHVIRDTYKKLMEIAETHKMQCKDRRTMSLLPEHFDIIDFACENPIDPEVLEHMCHKDLLIAYWKVGDDKKPLPDVLLAYAHDLTHPQKKVNDAGEEETIPALLANLEIKLSTKLDGGVEKDEPQAAADDSPADILDDVLPGEEVELAEGETQEETATKPQEIASVASSDDAQIILVPPVWVPKDRRTHATLIYVFFRNQTAAFLPPDPIPDPPHIVMAFDAYKKKDIFEVIQKNKDNILAYGFFTNDNPDKTELIACSEAEYKKKVSSISDKLIVKVAKKTSHTMLAFANFGPSLVSANTVVGKEEALKFFPEGFVNEDLVKEEK